MDMKELDIPPLGGGENRNYFVEYAAGVKALLRVSMGSEVNETLRDYYNYTGFTSNDLGFVQKRTPQEQYEFSRDAAEQGLAVLQPIALEGGNVVYPFLGQTQTLMSYLQNGGKHQTTMLPAIFSDMRKAHRLGFIYGDRNVENILIGDQGFTHIDFDLAISGRTAREFEVAELALHILRYGEGAVLPTLATTLGAMCAQTPGWIDLDKSTRYMRRMGEIYYKDLGAGPDILANQEALATSAFATRDLAMRNLVPFSNT
jgi:hypothetical protein